jgi:hypothetical protein
VTERVLQGPFLTRARAGRLAGVPGWVIAHRPDLLAIRSRWLQEAYFAFQFDDTGVRHDVGRVVQHLKGRVSDIDIADWLVRPNHALHGLTPLRYLGVHGGIGVERVLLAADSDGPIAGDLGIEFVVRSASEPLGGLAGTPAPSGASLPTQPVESGLSRRRPPDTRRKGRSKPAAATR